MSKKITEAISRTWIPIWNDIRRSNNTSNLKHFSKMPSFLYHQVTKSVTNIRVHSYLGSKLFKKVIRRKQTGN